MFKMKSYFLTCLLICLFFNPGPTASGAEVPVSLIVEAHKERVLAPGFAFELRFGQPMIPEDAVGLTDAVSPLRIQPPMAGRWR